MHAAGVSEADATAAVCAAACSRGVFTRSLRETIGKELQELMRYATEDFADIGRDGGGGALRTPFTYPAK
jgi:hypothetical protein